LTASAIATEVSEAGPVLRSFSEAGLSLLCIAFSNESKAVEFEEYLKSGSGHAFAKKGFGNRLLFGCSEVYQASED
jgi:hypothetical protein